LFAVSRKPPPEQKATKNTTLPPFPKPSNPNPEMHVQRNKYTPIKSCEKKEQPTSAFSKKNLHFSCTKELNFKYNPEKNSQGVP